jgi:hypothetical protein
MIKIFSETHRDGCLDYENVSTNDASVYDQKIDKYFEFLEGKAKSMGFDLEVLDRLNGLSYWAETDEEHEFMLYGIPDFWEWFHGSR